MIDSDQKTHTIYHDIQKLNVVIFDFDGTLIKKNTLLDFFIYTFPFKKNFVSCFRLFPHFIKFLIGKKTNSDFKEKLLTLFLDKMPLKEFDQLCLNYKERLNKIINPKAISKLLWHKKQGHKIIIISASPENWISPWAKTYNIEVMATRLEEIGGILTGHLSGKNCYGPEKIRRLLEKYPNYVDYNLYAYGDGPSDKEILKIANYPFKGNFGKLELTL